MIEGADEALGSHIEREVKLTPPPSFELSDLDVVIDGWRVELLPPLDLVAVYFDTDELTLARAGITIRHRTGDGSPTWTVKLPVSVRSGVLARRELNIEGPRNRRPRQIGSTVAAHLRGRRLVPVLEIRTQRNRALVADELGTALVEVASDTVTATRGRQAVASWAEIEIEAVDAAEGSTAQRKVARAMRKAGSTKAPSIPKLVRALGDEASAPPEVSIAPLPRHPKVADVLGHAFGRSVVQILAHDPGVRVGGDPEDLHQLRVATRRLRSDLRTFSEFVDPDLSERIGPDLRWVADQTNRLRDLDVMAEWLAQRAAQLPAEDQPALETLLQHCDAQRGAAHASVLRSLGSARYLNMIDNLLRLLDTPKQINRKHEHRARKRLVRQTRRRWKSLDAQMQALGDHPTDDDLHRARITTKRCRAAVEATAPLVSSKTNRLARSLAELQDVLGAVHDATQIEAWLRQTSDPSAAFAAGQLAAIARAEGRSHAARWPNAWAKVLRRYRSS